MNTQIKLPDPARNTAISSADIIDPKLYAEQRKGLREEMIPVKAPRRIAVGPDATFYFENYLTMWYQVHEMLHAEKGGEEQLKDELAAYNPLIPNGSELVATLMFEINDADRRERVLQQLSGVETKAFLRFGDFEVFAVPEMDVERTKETGRTSSVHFLHFPFTEDEAASFKTDKGDITLGIAHPNYNHRAILNGQSLTSLRKDLA
jgi:uncharacterized protein DUF3501